MLLQNHAVIFHECVSLDWKRLCWRIMLFVMDVLLGSSCVLAESCCYLSSMCLNGLKAAVLLQNHAVICHECVVGKQLCYCRIMLVFVMHVFQLLGSSGGKKVNPRDVAQAIVEKLPETDFYDKVTNRERDREHNRQNK